MSKRLKQLVLAAALLQVVGYTCAQELSNHKGQRRASFQEAYVDDGLTAASLAKHEGISVAEAMRRLEIMNEASQLMSRLQYSYPDTYGAVRAKNGRSFSIEFGFHGVARQVALTQIRHMASTKRLRNAISVVEMPMSARSVKEEAKELLDLALASGIEASVAFDQISGEIKLLTPNPDAARSKLTPKMNRPLDFNKFYKIEKFAGITPAVGAGSRTASTASWEYRDFISGGWYLDSTGGRLCTGGFVVSDGINFGLSTAGHCSNVNTYYYKDQNGYLSSIGSHLFPLRGEWTGNNLDVQWSTTSSTIAKDVLWISSFFNGTSVVDVKGVQNEYPGLYVCKYGRTTSYSCGYVDQYLHVTSYGYLSRINANGTYPVQTLGGDSGGPVFSGRIAVGIMHGKDEQGNAYFNAIREWWAKTNIMVTCYC